MDSALDGMHALKTFASSHEKDTRELSMDNPQDIDVAKSTETRLAAARSFLPIVKWGPCHRPPSPTFPPTCHFFEANSCLPPTRYKGQSVCATSHWRADVGPQTRQRPRRSGHGPRSLLRPARNFDEAAFEEQLHLSHLSTSQPQVRQSMHFLFISTTWI